MAFNDEHHRQVVDSLDTAKILKEALTVVDNLAKMDADDIFANDDDREKLEELIEKANILTKNKLWKLK